MTVQKSLEAITSTSTEPVVTPIPVIKSPPPDANIPVPPEGTTNTNGGDYRAALPRNMEQAAMPDVLEELARFAKYSAVFGTTAPPLTYMLQTFTAASQWTAMRVKTDAWDKFSRTQEGAAWSAARVLMAAFSPAFQLALRADTTLAQEFPALIRLFDAKKVIARRAVVTRLANKKDVAEGRAPSHGKVGRRAKKVLREAAALAASAAPASRETGASATERSSESAASGGGAAPSASR